ncbi:hypothetical protein R3P38DRAFT_3195285 [Favolaschia claudopus]|uniref:Uncharacterized protein n=1 Tax=Favolaschia claudopus TaxID=2862362 RepID=A0AAW0BC21_9AGAR
MILWTLFCRRTLLSITCITFFTDFPVDIVLLLNRIAIRTRFDYLRPLPAIYPMSTLRAPIHIFTLSIVYIFPSATPLSCLTLLLLRHRSRHPTTPPLRRSAPLSMRPTYVLYMYYITTASKHPNHSTSGLQHASQSAYKPGHPPAFYFALSRLSPLPNPLHPPAASIHAPRDPPYSPYFSFTDMPPLLRLLSPPPTRPSPYAPPSRLWLSSSTLIP